MKKGMLLLVSLVVVVAGVAALSAYEAHIVNVTAHIENALKVIPISRELDFGTVFPQEYREKRIDITTSESFCASTQTRVTSIDYKIVQKPKCVDQSGNHVSVDRTTEECPEGTTEMPLLCPYLSKTPTQQDPAPYTDYGVPAFHEPSALAIGTIDKNNDLSDGWIIDLAAPCFEGMCSQDWPDFVTEHNPQANPDDYMAPADQEDSTFGCDLWVEVTAIY